jgi:hypothetical protein
VRRVAARLAPWRYRRIYGAFSGQDVTEDAEGVVARSVELYCARLEGTGADAG